LRMHCRILVAVALLLVPCFGGISPAQNLGPGVEYLTYTLPGPNAAFVIKFRRDAADLELAQGYAFGRRSSQTKQAVSTIAAQYDQPPGYDVLAAVNGSFFGSGNDITGLLGTGNNLVQLPSLGFVWPTFAYLDNGECFITVNPGITDNQLRFGEGSSIGIDLLNEDRAANTLVVYTPDWGPSTTSTIQGTEVVLTGVNYPLRPNKTMSGIVSLVRTGAASLNNAIPAGGVVLAARDAKGTELATKAVVGQRVTFRISLSQSLLNNQRFLIDGAGWILQNGSANTAEWERYNSSFTGRNPRTALAWGPEHLYMVVVDGRQTGYSVGMSFAELAAFLRDTLGATDAVNLDGGGSSTMVVDGTLRNRPSDGSQRAVPNAVMLVRRTPTQIDLTDSFGSNGRQLSWDDKFTPNLVESFSPPSPGGDGFAMVVIDPAGGFESTRVGNRSDADVVVEADIYCEFRPGDAGNGYERSGIFARDQGEGAFESTSYGGGNNYLLAWDSHTGAVTAGRIVDGAVASFLPAPVSLASTAWRRFRIVCRGTSIEYFIDDEPVAAANDATFASGYSGVGYREYFATNSLARGARVDNFRLSYQTVDGSKENWVLH
jgi:hypothetical protein